MKKFLIILALILSSFNLVKAEDASLACEANSQNATINNTLNFTKNLYENRTPKVDEKEDDFLLVWYQNNAWEYYMNIDFIIIFLLFYWWIFFVLFIFIHLSFKVWTLWQK